MDLSFSRRRFHVAILILGFTVSACLSSLAADPPAAARIPVPDAVAQQEKLKLVRQLFKDDIANAKKPEDQTALVRKLMQSARETKNDPAGCLALYVTARDVALDSGDVDLTGDTIEEINQKFVIDALAMRFDAFNRLSKSKGGQLTSWIEQVSRLLDEALAADKYALAKQIAELNVDNARQNNDAARATAAAARAKEVGEIEAAYGGLKTSLASLEKNPADPAANLELGKFYCLLKGDWDHGLAMLALSKDARLSGVAQKELKGGDAAALAAIGDAWLDLSAKETGLYKKGMQARAYQHYVDAAPQLAGLQKLAVEKQIKDLEPLVKPPAPAGQAHGGGGGGPVPGAPGKNARNLLGLIPKDHGNAFGLVLTSNVQGRQGISREVFPYEFPAEYDLTIEFARVEGNGPGNVFDSFMTINLPHANSTCYFRINTLERETVYGFSKPAGNPGRKDTPEVRDAAMEKAKRYRMVFEVREKTMKIYLDGKQILTVDDYASVGLQGNNQFTIEVRSAVVRFSTITVSEISGVGRINQRRP